MPLTKEAFKQIRDKRKEHIFHTAAEIFARNGLASTKISDLAEAAGISQGLLYRYFASKEELFAELIEGAIQRMVKLVQASLKHPGTPWDKLLWLTKQLLQGISEHRTYYQLYSQAFALSGSMRKIIKKMETMRDVLRQLIIEGQKTGKVSKQNPDQLVLLYLCCLYGLAAGMGLFSDMAATHFPDAETFLNILKP